jgi:hypothetical protein
LMNPMFCGVIRAPGANPPIEETEAPAAKPESRAVPGTA